MTDLNDLHIMLGRALEGIESLERGVTGINKRLDDKIEPVLDDYKQSKNRLLGVCFAISAMVGGGVSGVLQLFKH